MKGKKLLIIGGGAVALSLSVGIAAMSLVKKQIDSKDESIKQIEEECSGEELPTNK